MTDRYDLLIASMRESAQVVNVVAALAVATLAARWSIKYIPDPKMVRNLFDLWLVLCVLVLFVVSK
ncbi:MAG: hypothetical protein DYG86_01345 [Chloroflexi bacterium CFX2]|nr:hypothetical protein [Chloroflexi bacterium CFX2]